MKVKFALIGLLAILFLSMGMVAAESNMSAETDGDILSEPISTEDMGLSEDNEVVQGYDPENFQPRIIPEGYSYRQNIPDEINYTTDYDDYYGYYVSVVDEDGYNIPDLEIRLVNANTNEEELSFDYDEEEDSYFCYVSAMGVGKHSCRIMVDDYYYNIKPIDFNLEIVKSEVNLILKESYVARGDYAILKAKVTDMDDVAIFDGGKVKFTVNGKNYYRSINDDGVATLKVKMSKVGTFTYSARYEGDKNHNPSVTKKSKIHVLSTTKKSRTVSIKGYKVVIPLSKYKNLISAKTTGKTYVYKLSTGKTIKQKVDIYNKKTWKKTTKTVKSKVIFFIAFDGAYEYTGSLPGEQYVAELTTSNQHRSGNIICHKWLFGYKQSKQFTKLNSAKVRQSLRGL
ncbi:MAG: Ig-like domain repeat protein [Methanobrevibacter sp.]|nr:Ig-like domain repeat protein [Methanobrevibacter sp.]